MQSLSAVLCLPHPVTNAALEPFSNCQYELHVFVSLSLWDLALYRINTIYADQSLQFWYTDEPKILMKKMAHRVFKKQSPLDDCLQHSRWRAWKMWNTTTWCYCQRWPRASFSHWITSKTGECWVLLAENGPITDVPEDVRVQDWDTRLDWIAISPMGILNSPFVLPESLSVVQLNDISSRIIWYPFQRSIALTATIIIDNSSRNGLLGIFFR